MSRRTAVAAPSQPPIDAMLATIDAMDGPTLRAFLAALRKRFNLAAPSAVECDIRLVTRVTLRDLPAFDRPRNYERWQ